MPHTYRETSHGPYAEQTLAALKVIAAAKNRAYGLRGYSSLKKADLIAHLQKFDAQLVAPPPTPAPAPAPPPMDAFKLRKPIKAIRIKNRAPRAITVRDALLQMKAAPGYNKKYYTSISNMFARAGAQLLHDTPNVSWVDVPMWDIAENDYDIVRKATGTGPAGLKALQWAIHNVPHFTPA